MPYLSDRAELRRVLMGSVGLLISLVLVLALPVPDAARGVAGYVPLHVILETLAIAVAAMIFGISYAVQRYRPNARVLFIGLAFLGVALLDLTHTLSFQGMPDFVQVSGPEQAINFWLASRTLAAGALITLAFGPSDWRFLGHVRPLEALAVLLCGVGLVHYVLWFQGDWIPRMFVAGEGLTAFKVGYEYVLILAYGLAGLGFLMRSVSARRQNVARLVLASFTMASSEYCLTLYANVTDIYNLMGHVYKVLAYAFLYRALFSEAVQTPYVELQESKSRLIATLQTLPDLLFEVDHQGTYRAVYANEVQKLAAPVEDLVGKNLREILPAEAVAGCMAAMDEAHVKGISRGQRIQIPLAVGALHFELSVARKLGPGHQPETFLVLSRDVTEVVRHEQLIEFESAFNAGLLDLQRHALLEGEEALLKRGARLAQTLTASHQAQVELLGEPGAFMETSDVPAMTGDTSSDEGETTAGNASLRLATADPDQRDATQTPMSVPPGESASEALPGMVVSASDGVRVRMVLRVSGKPVGYSAREEQALQILADTLWSHVRRRRQEAVIHRLSESLEQSPHPVVITDTQARIQYVNNAFHAVSGYSLAEVQGKNPRLLQSGKTPGFVYRQMWAQLKLGLPWQGEFVNQRKDGVHYIERASLYAIRDASGAVTHYVAHKEDITQRRASEERIKALSEFDGLTGLLNKKAFDNRLVQTIEQAVRQHLRFSLLWIDLDNFNAVNESLGREAGDELLIEMARRLRVAMGSQTTLARYSGDSFVGILMTDKQDEIVMRMTQALRKLHETATIQGSPFSISASAGIAVFPLDADTASALTSAAEAAMFRVKQEGRNGLRFFAPEMQRHTQRSLELASALQHAIALGQLRLVYQPQRVMASGRMSGAEALLRWEHPRWGAISPAEFIPMAERTGVIVDMGNWVVAQVASQIRRWDAAGLHLDSVAVNVSAVQFARPGLVSELVQLLQAHGIAAQRLEIELTEAVALSDPQRAAASIVQLHEAGFRISLDDFGTGYSSMSYLKRYAIDKLKIDQSFVRDLVQSESDQAIVRAIVSMAHSLQMTTIAEGVETAEQASILQTMGCDAIQGYWYSRPLEVADFESFAATTP